ncbi:hypothetical protein AX17_006640 [Amanita inopinata Kibby_2008]|nr:hypothetical protein AX17_006640 [Amanita inopinata Kibby_2008]
MPTNVHITEYAPPVLRAASPASSVGTMYGEDQTSLSDLELSDGALARKYDDLLELRKPRKEEEAANIAPLLERPESGSQEEKDLYEKVLLSLRKQVRELEENELFEETLLRGSHAGLVQPPSTDDIDALMRSMMGTNVQTTGSFARRTRSSHESEPLTQGPWFKNDMKGRPPSLQDENSEADAESVYTMLGRVGKRSKRSKGP